ncbi:hypothetical protein S40285_05158 [Stachybotrys chlorohalonatus IBT 40285]|uniref:Transcription elongation factor 1 homolog n=1 Tax=Stachybotrys chlorohalonatus (strain IBT 40285) TaxID=1283841 RepID=A0A084QF74_STAC4|nr:hypothetical protein S40285_05158 [Stachybotrys chlorohalonata IBT 40285]
MGKRKSSKKPMGPKKVEKLPTSFTCLFCNHEKSVSVKLDKKAGVGELDCSLCGQKFQCAINYLSAAVDVYGEWVDAADAVAKEGNIEPGYEGSARATTTGRMTGRRTTAGDDDDEPRYEGDGIVADDEEY